MEKNSGAQKKPPLHIKNNTAPQRRSLLSRILEIKEWIGLGVITITAIVSSGGWILTYFAKKEEVDTIACTMDVNVRLAKNISSTQFIQERQIQLKRRLRDSMRMDKGSKGKKTVLSDDGDDEYSSIEELRGAIKVAKEDLKTLSEDASFFQKSLAQKDCDSKERREKLRDKLQLDPPLKGG